MRWVGIWVGLVLAAGLASACESEESNGGGTGGGTASTFDASDCGLCVTQACTAEADACAGDPGCAAYLACLYECPLDVLGNADESCEATCPTPDSSAAVDLVSDYTYCRLDGAGATCAPCGFASVFGQQCGPSPETNPCWKCEEEKCCDTMAGCKDDPGCDEIAPCIQACPPGDGACEDQCILDHAAVMPLFGARLTCIWGQCPSECAGGPLDPCVACVIDQCSNSHVACHANAECYVLEGCVGDCDGDEACIDTCLATYPNGVPEFNLFSICAVQKCSTSC